MSHQFHRCRQAGNVNSIVVFILGVVCAGALCVVVAFMRHENQLAGKMAVQRRTMCLHNLMGIGFWSITYADANQDSYPCDSGEKPRAIASFQAMADFSADTPWLGDFDFRILVSPAHNDVPATPAADGSVVLQPNNVSYAYRAKRTGTTADVRTVLASNDTYQGAPNNESSEGHVGGVLALYISGETKWVPSSRLPAGSRFPEGLIDVEGRNGWGR